VGSLETFKSLIKKEIEVKKDRSAAVWHALNESKRLIEEARSLGVSFTKISIFMNEAGIRATPLQVKAFCLDVLKEVPKRRKKRNSRRATSSLGRTQTKSRKTIQKAETPHLEAVRHSSTTAINSRSNFRTARKDLV